MTEIGLEPRQSSQGSVAAPPALAVLGVDPGSRWTAGCLRFGDTALDGWTVGPRDEAGRRHATALERVDDVAAAARYIHRVCDTIAETLDRARDVHGLARVRLAVENMHVPKGWMAGNRTRVSIVDWLMPRQVVIGVLAAFPDARLIEPAGYGKRPPADYPSELRRRRPASWGGNDNPKGERDHERAAYDVAGAAARLP